MFLLGYLVWVILCVLLVYLYIKTTVKPTYAEFGRMSLLVWKYDWNFCLTDYGATKVFKEGENTTYTYSGKWMYKLLMKDRPSQELKF